MRIEDEDRGERRRSSVCLVLLYLIDILQQYDDFDSCTRQWKTHIHLKLLLNEHIFQIECKIICVPKIYLHPCFIFICNITFY